MKISINNKIVISAPTSSYYKGCLVKFMCGVLDSVDKFSSSADSKIYT